MKKFSILALTLMLALSFAACGGDKQVKTEEPAKKEEAKKADPKVACKADCDKTNDACVKSAGKDAKKAKACADAKTKCVANCDAKKAEPVKKAEPAKKAPAKKAPAKK